MLRIIEVVAVVVGGASRSRWCGGGFAFSVGPVVTDQPDRRQELASVPDGEVVERRLGCDGEVEAVLVAVDGDGGRVRGAARGPLPC